MPTPRGFRWLLTSRSGGGLPTFPPLKARPRMSYLWDGRTFCEVPLGQERVAAASTSCCRGCGLDMGGSCAHFGIGSTGEWWRSRAVQYRAVRSHVFEL